MPHTCSKEILVPIAPTSVSIKSDEKGNRNFSPKPSKSNDPDFDLRSPVEDQRFQSEI